MQQYSTICVIVLVLIHYTHGIALSSFSISTKKMVSYSIPEKRAFKKSLGYNEDTYLNFTELTTKYRYPTEVHSVTTEDGYILSIFRIISKCSDQNKSYPVLLVHGITDTSDTWIIAGTKVGLAFILADNCYDVWAINNRGNYYSQKHASLDPNKDVEYWNFTFDEYGNFDLPATIDYILEKTGYSQLFYIGHSQGTTQYFAMGSLKPDYNDKIKLAIQLAPVVWMKDLPNPIPVIIAQYYEEIKLFFESAGFSNLFARDRLEHELFEFLCERAPNSCEIALSIVTGYKQGTISLERIPVIMGHVLSGCSLKSLAHFAQLIRSGKFQRYDEGIKGNVLRYGVTKPPQYNISLVTSPVVLMAGSSDTLSSLIDLKRLASKLSGLVETYIVPESYWSHANFLWGIQAPVLVYSKILDYFNTYKIFR